MKRIIISLAAVLALAVGALPTGAATSTPTGVRLSLLGGPDTSRSILANTAFHVRHGFTRSGDATPADVQQSSVNLSVNGVNQNGVIIQQFSDTKPRTLVGKFSLFNFPNGLAPGSYTFTITFTFRGQDTLVRNITIDSLATCENGTVDGLLCAPPPA